MHFNVRLVENRFPILFEPFALKDLNTDMYHYDIISYQQADQGIVDFLKYLSNFVFYRFGLEVKSDESPSIFQNTTPMMFRSAI